MILDEVVVYNYWFYVFQMPLSIQEWALPDMDIVLCSDGAAALVLVSGAMAVKLGLYVIAKIRGFADAAQVL